ncbi:hypothetical protein [Ferruginibacter sp.]
MRFCVILIFSFFLLLESFSQIPSSVVKYNSIGIFKIDEPKAKYNKILTPIPSGNQKWKDDFYTMYINNRDSLIPVTIDTIRFDNVFFNFIGDSNLSDFWLDILYNDSGTRKISRYQFTDGEKHFQIIKTYVEHQLQKKGEYKNYSGLKSYIYYGYEWRRKGFKVRLDIQHDAVNPKSSSIILTFATKYSPFW